MKLLDISSVSAIVAAGGVLVGVIFTALQLRDLVRTRQTDLVMRLYSTFGSKEFQEGLMKFMSLEFEDYNDFKRKYASTVSDYSETPESIAMEMITVFYEGIGVLLHRKLISIELVDDLFTGPIRSTWGKMKQLLDGYRRKTYPTQLEYFEYLAKELQKREQTLPAQQ